MSGLDHVAILVSDLDAAVKLYRDVYGLALAEIEEVPTEKVRVAIFGHGAGRIELVCPTDPQSSLAKRIREKGEGLHHVCLAVPDIEKAMGALRARGAPLLDDEPPAPRAASADLLRAAGIPVLGAEPPHRAPAPPPPPFAAPPGREAPAHDGAEARREIESLRRELEEARAATARAEREAKERNGDMNLQKTKLDGMRATVKRLEADLKNAREETRRAAEKASATERELDELRARADEAERVAAEKGAAGAEAAGRLAALERELEELKTELLVARGEAEGARGDVDKRSAELRRRVQELESATAKHEERVVKAYQKIKSDEKLREKTRKALTIALQLLDERAPVESGEKESRTAPRE